MRILKFKGRFGYLKNELHEGIILFCQFEPFDDEKILDKIANKFRLNKENKLILVPFAHLYEKSASKENSEKLFKLFSKKCMNLNKEIVIIPFGIKKEFYLYAYDDNSTIKFMSFK